jgi:hypothetical protein
MDCRERLSVNQATATIYSSEKRVPRCEVSVNKNCFALRRVPDKTRMPSACLHAWYCLFRILFSFLFSLIPLVPPLIFPPHPFLIVRHKQVTGHRLETFPSEYNRERRQDDRNPNIRPDDHMSD